MGNDTSILSEYEVDETPYGRVPPWSLHWAHQRNDPSARKVTVLSAKVASSSSSVDHEFRPAFESLKKLRHPNILRYLNSCIVGDKAYLIVEAVKPLSRVVANQTELEICCGLRDVLAALDFLHTRAGMVHNNICSESVLVGEEGRWKLGFFDVSCLVSELNAERLARMRPRRHDSAVAPEDAAGAPIAARHAAARDLFAYGGLVTETLGQRPDALKVPEAEAFRDLARDQLRNVSPAVRGTAGTLSSNPYFDRPLLRVRAFLSQIAIKSPSAKEEFFTSLPALLRTLPEEVIGAKLADVLLSRMVVLNAAARRHLLPLLLVPRSVEPAPAAAVATSSPADSLSDAIVDPAEKLRTDTSGLLDAANYRRYVVPVISRIFPVRDAQIRQVLLQYLPSFVRHMEIDFLRQQLLPELLLGIKDTEDSVVAATLKALAELVPLLGASAVIGGQRQRLFANGAPKCSAPTPIEASTPPTAEKHLLPERHAPDGGEDADQDDVDDVNLVSDVEPVNEVSDAEGGWSDWEETEESPSSTTVAEAPKLTTALPTLSTLKPVKRPVADDLSALDIQIKCKEDEIDYFADMAPTITASTYASGATGSVAALDFKLHDDAQGDDANDGWNWDE